MTDVTITQITADWQTTPGWKLSWKTAKGAPQSKMFASLQDATDHYYFLQGAK